MSVVKRDVLSPNVNLTDPWFECIVTKNLSEKEQLVKETNKRKKFNSEEIFEMAAMPFPCNGLIFDVLINLNLLQ